MAIFRSRFTAQVIVLVITGCLTTSLHAATEVPDTVTNGIQATAVQEAQQQLLQIGYLSYDSALVAMPGYALVQARHKELRQAYEAELQRVGDDFNHKYESFLEGMRDFPRTILLKRQTELQQLLQQNMEFKRKAQKELEQALEDALAPLRLELDEAIAAVAREKGLALVVNTDSRACPFIAPDMGVDVLGDVLEQLHSKK